MHHKTFLCIGCFIVTLSYNYKNDMFLAQMLSVAYGMFRMKCEIMNISVLLCPALSLNNLLPKMLGDISVFSDIFKPEFGWKEEIG